MLIKEIAFTHYEFKIEFTNPTRFNVFEQKEGAINGWQKCSGTDFVSITNSDKTILAVGRAFYTTRANKKTFRLKEGDALEFKLVGKYCLYKIKNNDGAMEISVPKSVKLKINESYRLYFKNMPPEAETYGAWLKNKILLESFLGYEVKLN